MIFSVQVEVTLREGIADPEGSTIERSLPTLGFPGVRGVQVGKLIRFRIEADDEAAARSEVDDLCHRFLSNPVLEDSAVRIEAAPTASV
ncbi:MAG TPA: phosphoribosylformylglycinamidine synthase subunit PurS [Acidimicrobiales bacterium]|nr:phosphoribosylformylglycinamidine synthase subunit PurS [Acidimicrobiales bacterium]